MEKDVKKGSGEVLDYLIENLILYLEELCAITDRSSFTDGEVTAFAECLEIASMWEDFNKFGIDNVEKKFLIK